MLVHVAGCLWSSECIRACSSLARHSQLVEVVNNNNNERKKVKTKRGHTLLLPCACVHPPVLCAPVLILLHWGQVPTIHCCMLLGSLLIVHLGSACLLLCVFWPACSSLHVWACHA